MKTAFSFGILGVGRRRLFLTEFWIKTMRNNKTMRIKATPALVYTKVLAITTHRMISYEILGSNGKEGWVVMDCRNTNDIGLSVVKPGEARRASPA